MRLLRVMRTRWRPMLLLAGGLLAVAGIVLSSSLTLMPGVMVVLLTVRIPQNSSTAFIDPALMPFLVDARKCGGSGECVCCGAESEAGGTLARKMGPCQLCPAADRRGRGYPVTAGTRAAVVPAACRAEVRVRVRRPRARPRVGAGQTRWPDRAAHPRRRHLTRPRNSPLYSRR